MLILTRHFYSQSVNPLLKLAVPLILTGLIESCSPFFGTVFLAELGSAELAAGALVRGLFFTLMVVLWGILTSVSILVAQKHGEKDDKAVAQILRDGSLLAFILTPPSFLLLWYIAPIFYLFGQNETVVNLAQSYMRGLAWGILPDFMTLVLLQFLTGIGHTRLTMIFMLCWTPLAIFLNYVLVFGELGFPSLDIAGLGVGLTISYWVAVCVLIIYLMMSKTYKSYMFNALSFSEKSYLRELLQVGVPLGAMYCLEVGFFFVLTLMMGLIGEAQLAATQIAMQYLGIFISVVFSTAQAVTVRMGHKLGEKNYTEANDANMAGIFVAVSFMLIIAIFYLCLPQILIGIDLNMTDPVNAEVIKYSRQFLILCALFQIFEAARIALMGSLRALKDTRFTLLTSVVGFWLIPLPIAYFLIQIGMGGASLWVGMVAGAICSALLLQYRYQRKFKHYLHGPAMLDRYLVEKP